jgi:hypothetical protein
MVRARGVLLDRPSWLPAVALSTALAMVLLAWDPHVRDLAAQSFRVELFERSGLLWNASWYGGHYVVTYSLLFPPLASLFGTRIVGAASVVVGAYFFDRLVRERWGERARPATLWYGAGAVTMLASGRLSFALGAALALASLRALQQKRAFAAATAALAAALASPVAGAFLAGIVAALVLAERERAVRGLLVVAGAAVIPVVALNVVFPDGGREPFSLSSFIAVPLWSAGALYVTRGMREERSLRAVVALYLCACALIWLIPNPMGGNATRLGALFGGPMLAAVTLARRPHVPAVVLVAVLAGSLYWQVQSAVRDVFDSVGDPATQSTYYEPLQDWLHAHGGRHARIEVPPTLNHWEAAYLSPRFELARGWLRQLDRTRNHVFYEGRLTAARYRSWLWRNGVRYVALSDASVDYSAKAERRLIAGHPSYLRLRATLPHWRVYEVRGTRPLLQGAGRGDARLISLEPQSFALHSSVRGRFVLRVRSSRFWRLTAGQGCIGRAGRWTAVRVDRPGVVRASIRFSLAGAVGASSGGRRRC